MEVEMVDDNVVGFDDDIKCIECWLLDPGIEERAIIAIVGESGFGKTTLARKIYKESKIKDYFPCRAWINVPRKFKLEDLLNDIIQQTMGRALAESDRPISDKLSQLSGKQYLIVLDNIQSIEDRNSFLAVIPPGERSRVVLTTQLELPQLAVAQRTARQQPPASLKAAANPNYHVVSLKGLAREHGEDLFHKRVFGQPNLTFKMRSQKLLRKLGGSPLAIVMLAGLLRAKEKDQWDNVIDLFCRKRGGKEGEKKEMEGQAQEKESNKNRGREKNKEENKILEEGYETKEEEEEEEAVAAAAMGKGTNEEKSNKISGGKKKRVKNNKEEIQNDEEKRQRENKEQNEGGSEEEKDREDTKAKEKCSCPNTKQVEKRKELLHRGSAIERIVQLSFDDLPPRLKPCFLYFTAFKGDAEIDAQKLVRLWIAEGFVPQQPGQTMEETGQAYLKELVSRCMIILLKKDALDNVVKVGIHERVLAFAWSEAEETNFLQAHPSIDSLAFGTVRRLSLINNNVGGFNPLTLSAPKLRSIQCDFPEELEPARSSGLESSKSCMHICKKKLARLTRANPNRFTIHQSKFLRVMDLKGAKLSHLPKEIGTLINLRYMGLSHRQLKQLPEELHKLHNLQTLDIAGTNVKELPKTFWEIQALRHVLAKRLAPPQHVGDLIHLQSLQGIGWGPWVRRGNGIKRMTNLRSLQVWGLSTEGDVEVLLDALNHLDCLISLDLEGKQPPTATLLTMLSLRRLQHLRLCGEVVRVMKPEVYEKNYGHYLLPNLIRLELCSSQVGQEFIHMLAKVPNMAELVLEKDSYKETVLKFPARGFNNLKKLRLSGLGELKACKIEAVSMPSLRELSIANCKNLEAFPEGLEQCENLKELVLDNMPALAKGREFFKIKQVHVIHICGDA